MAKTCNLGQQDPVVTFDQSGSKDSRDAILKVEELHNENISSLRRQSQPRIEARKRQHQRKPHLLGEQLSDIHADASRTTLYHKDWHRSCGVWSSATLRTNHCGAACTEHVLESAHSL